MSSVKENAFLLNQVTPFDLDTLLYFWRTNYLVMGLEEVQAKQQRKRLSEMLFMERAADAASLGAVSNGSRQQVPLRRQLAVQRWPKCLTATCLKF